MQYNNKGQSLTVVQETRDVIPQSKLGMKYHFSVIGDEIGWVLEDGSFYPEPDEMYKTYTKSGIYLPVEDRDYFGERQWNVKSHIPNRIVWREGKYWWVCPNGELSQREPSCFTYKTLSTEVTEVPHSKFYTKSEKEINMKRIACEATATDIIWLKDYAVRHGLDCSWSRYSKRDVEFCNFFIIEENNSINACGSFSGTKVSLSEIIARIEKYNPPFKVGEYEVKLRNNGDIQVGCQSLSFDLVEKLYLAAKAKKESK